MPGEDKYGGSRRSLPSVEEERYSTYNVGEETVVYNTTNTDAWLRSNSAVEIEELL